MCEIIENVASHKTQIKALGAQLRQFDYDRYLCSLFAHERGREDLWRLFGIHFEISKIPATVSDPRLAMLRLKWWQDAITDGVSGPDWMQELLAKPCVDAEALQSLIKAHDLSLQQHPFGTPNDLDEYAMVTSGALMQIAGQVLLNERDMDSDVNEYLLNIGRLWAHLGIMRSVVYAAHKQKVLVPGGYLGCSPEQFLSEIGSKEGSLQEVGQKMFCDAEPLFDLVAYPPKHIPRKLRPLMLFVALSKLYASRLKLAGFDLASETLVPSQIRRVFQVGVSFWIR